MSDHFHKDELKDSGWKKQELAYQTLLFLENESAEIVFGNDNWQKAFSEQPKVVKCIDERVVIGEQSTIGLAGSGVLVSDQDYPSLVAKLKLAGVSEVTYHEGCGACRLFCKQELEKCGDKLDEEEVALNSAYKLNNALEINSNPTRSGYSPSDQYQMTGDIHLHHARAIYVDGTGCFNPQLLDIPAGFLVSAKYHPNIEYTKQEVNIAIGIALGGHGFGKEYFSKEPLIVLVIGSKSDPSLSSNTLIKEITPIVNENKELVKIITSS